MKAPLKIILMALALSMTMLMELHAQTDSTNYNIEYLTAAEWQLKEIEVSDQTYNDPTLTDLSYDFTPHGEITITAGGSSATTNWQFSDLNHTQIVINSTTPEQQVLTIEVLTYDTFIYTVNYQIDGTTYSYRFKMVSI